MIEELIKKIAGRLIQVINFEAEVVSVDMVKDTCVVKAIDGYEVEGVKLKSILSDLESKFLLYPKVGSFVTCSILHNVATECYVSQYSEIDKVVWNCEEIVINGGSNGGLVKWPSAKTELDKTNEVLQAIVTVLTGPSIPEPGNAAPSALQASLSGALTGKALGSLDNLENSKVKH